MPDAGTMTLAGPARWAHQRRGFEQSKDAEYFAIFWEQRCGKTPVLIDTVAHLYRQGKINAQIHLAPNGVHADYAREYLPTYLGDAANWHAYTWRSAKAEQVGETKEREALLRFKGFAILSVNIDAIKTLTFRKYAARFLKRRRALASIDESLDIAHWNKRTRVALEIGKRSLYRRILDGTPADASPLGMYYPSQFLRPGCFGFRSNLAYKQRYAVMEPRCMAMGMRKHEINPQTGVCDYCHRRQPEFSSVIDYQNIDELRACWTTISSRVLREECVDMPPKVYERRSFELSKEQRRIYDQLRAEYYAETAEGGEVDGTHVLTRMLRLQQIASNHLPAAASWVPCPHCAPPYHDCEHCGGYGFMPGVKGVTKLIDAAEPRLDALDQVVAQLRPLDQVVVWSRFQADREAIQRWAHGRGEDSARYDGLVKNERRQENYDRFRSGAARYFNADPVSGGRGLDLSAASCVVYYSHGWSLRFRRQSEDRAQNLGKKGATLYVDLVAEDTVDQIILDTLRAGKDLAAEVMGDPRSAWI